MPGDEDIALDEKRMYGDRREETIAYLACEMGVARVALSDDQIGRFGLEHRCSARDVAGADGQLVVATDEDVLLGVAGSFTPADFGPAVAVGVGESVLAAGPDGTVARLDGDEWTTLGTVSAVRAIDGDLVAAADGVYQVEGDELVSLGLDDVRGVASAGSLAVTGDGLFERGDGWELETAGDGSVVACETERSEASTRSHAVVDGDLLERAEGAWRPADPPEQGVVDVAYDAATVAVTGDGTVLIDPVAAKDGTPEWRSRSLGLAGVAGVAVP